MDAKVETWLARASRGDGAALDELLERYLPGLHGFVRLRAGRMLLARESSSDLVQSICREVLQGAERFRFEGEQAFKGWLYTTAARKIADRYAYYRAQKRDADREEALGPTPSSAEAQALLLQYGSICTPSMQLAAREQIERIEGAFEHLPEDYREVILLSRLVGLSRKEVAETMGRSEASVRSLLSRALAMLAEHIE